MTSYLFMIFFFANIFAYGFIDPAEKVFFHCRANFNEMRQFKIKRFFNYPLPFYKFLV